MSDWRDHGAKIAGAGDVWMAFVSPEFEQRGEWRDHAPITTSQIAATLARWMGVDYGAVRAEAGPPIVQSFRGASGSLVSPNEAGKPFGQ